MFFSHEQDDDELQSGKKGRSAAKSQPLYTCRRKEKTLLHRRTLNQSIPEHAPNSTALVFILKPPKSSRDMRLNRM